MFAGKLAAYVDAHRLAMELFATRLREQASPKFSARAVHAAIGDLLAESPQVPMIIAHSLIPTEHEPRLIELAGETFDQVMDLLITDLHATPAQARQTFAELLLALVDRAAHPA
ncbi:hypothetical protein [Parenemella sanctibonifatiensis]|uniref:Uncharacterized protein n=1 Tax=Parenemella sanctibonifatiensis TaxID=2016505 RepID=A0A255EB96_9ACTN|nr:hypothetical protein [Parenemella sanctibonifatiensis]OYN88530.1 hypothetical protein CGZ91_13015 [Parenemella sanctibonifatiensis]